MNFKELIDEVTITLQETSPDILDRIPGWLNDALADAIEQARVPGFKQLETVDTVLDQAYTVLPSIFNGKMLYVGTKNGELENGTLEELLEDNPELDTTGSLYKVAVEGNLVYYQGIPDEVTSITLLYRRPPVEMVNDDDVPDGIPSWLCREVLVPGASMRGFNLIEDGIDGEKVNTNAQLILYNRGIFKLMEFVGRRVDHRSSSVWRY